ncbi:MULTISPECIES: asparagine synthase (glutamine-hydrolyzing) [unclassified Flavobacterium]|uniref:asparagine synthase (glutamine-hydrolyzing) n=1 Tax=unclassified Flavobacterium TaxID=196869 RepID=UPI001F12E10B|nr:MULTISPECIES: asparagine synthase (glutamine-hydrolyzing) [unclassified Flavobacterium]UMY65581.1 asparagine synthase (glutamine-hydrolyzing) [Flavobacterium sp. HJ-32-4]
MCGISGLLHFDAARRASEEWIVRMRDALEHRGPDDAGIFMDGALGLGHRRLSILDLSKAGHQPFTSHDGRYVMVYNGEIYNFRDFYGELKARGIDLRTGSDTEVLLALFQLHGTTMLSRLNGMFAFAVWDKQERRLTLVRDRMGVKPLYYALHDNSLFFASEQKALFKAGVPLRIAQDGLEEYIFNRFVAGEKTLCEGVYALLPGHIMTIEADGKTQMTKWWDLKSEILAHPKIAHPVEWFRELFNDSVRLRMISDAPVGVLLSGGLDSSSVAASLFEQGYKGINTFTIGFRESEHNEDYLARRLSKQFGFDFHSMILEDDAVFETLKSITYLHDDPLMHLSEPHLLAVSMLAKPNVKVLLSGEGADELMGGYYRYKPLQFPNLLHVLALFGRNAGAGQGGKIDKLFRFARIGSKRDMVLFNGSNIFPEDIASGFGISSLPENAYRKQLYEDARTLYPGDLRRKAMYVDQHTYLCSLLDRNDRCTMGASIECREPFLDQRLLAGLGSLDSKWFFTGKKGKYIQKKAMAGRLPEEILDFRKVGLSSPWDQYLLRNPAFKDELEAFRKSEIFRLPYLSSIDPSQLLKRLQQGDDRMISYIMPLFMLHMWTTYYAGRFTSTLM